MILFLLINFGFYKVLKFFGGKIKGPSLKLFSTSGHVWIAQLYPSNYGGIG